MMTAPISTTPQLMSVTPRLRVRDVVQAAEFYRDRLGFTIVSYEKRPPTRALVARDNLTLVLDLATWDATHGPDGLVDLEFVVDDLEGLATEFDARDLEVERGGSGRARWCRIKDADGHNLKFIERGY